MDEKLKDFGRMNPVSGPANERTPQAPVDPERRKFVKAGLVAAPLILTLRGQSALAQSTSSTGKQDPAMKSKMSSTHSSAMLEPLEQQSPSWGKLDRRGDQG
jgi:PqqD family protein of HPr-rel-A system